MPRKLDCRGVSAAEFAVVAPILVLLLFGTYDLGNAIQLSMQLERAARAGAQYAAVSPGNADDIRQATANALPGLAADVTVTYKCDGTVIGSPTAPCPSGSALTVTVTAERSLSPLLLQDMSRGTGNAVVRIR